MTSSEVDRPVRPELLAHVPPVGVVTILGSEGSGKSVLAYAILESLEHLGRPRYVYGLPEIKHHLLPEWLAITDTPEWPEGAIVLADEAHLAFYSRDSMTAINKFMDSFIGLVRQKGILALYVTQAGRKIDLGIISAARSLLIKRPSLLQEKLERRELRTILASATKAFRQLESKPLIVPTDLQALVGDDTTVQTNSLFSTYVINHDFEGMVAPSNRLPSFWTTELSRAFKGVPLDAAAQEARPSGGSLDAQMLAFRARQAPGDTCLVCIRPAVEICPCHGNGYCTEHAEHHRLTGEEIWQVP